MSEKTKRLMITLRNDVHKKLVEKAFEADVAPSTYIKILVSTAVHQKDERRSLLSEHGRESTYRVVG